MSHLHLTTEEDEILHDVLSTRLTELEVEILHTDHSAFRDLLKHRRKVLAGICERLTRTVDPVPPTA
jgi:hypothetical protein